MAETELDEKRLGLGVLIIALIAASIVYVHIVGLHRENNLLRHEIEGLKDEKRWIWSSAVTKRIEVGEPRIEWERRRIVIPVIGLSEENETLFVANASITFETDDASLLIQDDILYIFASGEIGSLKREIESLKADLEFYREQYIRYFQKYMDTQRGLLPLISNQTAFLALWNVSMHITISDLQYDYPLFGQNRTVHVRIGYYSLEKSYGLCIVEIHNFSWINHASFPVLSMEMINGSYARLEWRLLSEDETKFVIQQSLRLENVTFMDGKKIQEVYLTLLHEIPKKNGDS
jgi:hypothetical protein